MWFHYILAEKWARCPSQLVPPAWSWFYRKASLRYGRGQTASAGRVELALHMMPSWVSRPGTPFLLWWCTFVSVSPPPPVYTLPVCRQVTWPVHELYPAPPPRIQYLCLALLSCLVPRVCQYHHIIWWICRDSTGMSLPCCSGLMSRQACERSLCLGCRTRRYDVWPLQMFRRFCMHFHSPLPDTYRSNTVPGSIFPAWDTRMGGQESCGKHPSYRILQWRNLGAVVIISWWRYPRYYTWQFSAAVEYWRWPMSGHRDRTGHESGGICPWSSSPGLLKVTPEKGWMVVWWMALPCGLLPILPQASVSPRMHKERLTSDS